MPPPEKRGKKKPAPFPSTEWFIQNHGDIASVVCTLILFGLMISVTSGLARCFVLLQHSIELVIPPVAEVKDAPPSNETTTMYTYGPLDMCGVFFQLFAIVTVHALVQENVLEKLTRKLSLSKTRLGKFYESGQLLWFQTAAAGFGIYLLLTDPAFESVKSLWEGYPHANISMLIKVYFLVQIAYWIHWFPEFYIQKLKKEEIAERLPYICVYLIAIVLTYTLNFTRVALVLLVLHYLVEAPFHLLRLAHSASKSRIVVWGFRFWNLLFVLARLLSISIGVLVFHYGLEKSSTPSANFREGNFNTTIIRSA